MMKLKRILALAISIPLVVSLPACSPVKNTADNKVQKQALNVGAVSSVDVIPIIIADEKGFFKKAGVNVAFQPFKSSKDRDAAFQAESLDGVICDEIAVCLYQNADFNVKITGITDGDFMLIAGPDSGIKSINDIKGKGVAISEKTSIEYTLDKILEKNSMEPKDIKKSMVPAIPTRLEMLTNKKVDAALLPEPFSSLAMHQGGILLGSASKLATYPSVTAFTQKAIDTKSNEIKAFYKGYNEAVDYINSTPVSEYEATVMKTVGYPDDMKGKIILPRFRKNTLPSEDEVKSVIEWSAKNGLIKKALAPKDLMNSIGVK